jgi:hypothetical protein
MSQKKEIEKLLAVLDLTEEEQWRWVVSNQKEYGYKLNVIGGASCQMSLADLAFKLKNEAGKDFIFGLVQVFQYLTKRPKNIIPSPAEQIEKSQPIHWIIAARIAKLMANEEKSKT